MGANYSVHDSNMPYENTVVANLNKRREKRSFSTYDVKNLIENDYSNIKNQIKMALEFILNYFGI